MNKIKIEDLVEYDGVWYKKGTGDLCSKFTMVDLKELLAQQKEELLLEGEKSMARGVLRRIEKERNLEHIKVLCEAVSRLKL